MVTEKIDDDDDDNKKRRIAVRISISVIITVILIWAVLRPTKPKFTIQDATVFLFNVSAPNLLSSTIQVTISSRNPNDRVGIYYDPLDVLAVYRNEQITLPTTIRPVYQGHHDVNVWSPFLAGDNVPISPSYGPALIQDRPVLLSIKLESRVRFKVGTFISGRFHLNVDCPAAIVFGNPAAGVGVVGNNVVKYQLARPCSVSV